MYNPWSNSEMPSVLDLHHFGSNTHWEYKNIFVGNHYRFCQQGAPNNHLEMVAVGPIISNI